MSKLTSSINKKLSDRNYLNASQKAVKEYFDEINDDALPTLSIQEKEKIRMKWGNVIENVELGYHAHRVFKKYRGFDAEYVPEPYFYPYIIRCLNPTNDYTSLQHKGLYDSLFRGLAMPRTIAKRISGNMISGNAIISDIDLVDVLVKSKVDMIIKPAKDTNSGKGVGLIEVGSTMTEIQELLNQYTSDFVIQERVGQSSFTSQFNPTSLNTMRVVTLFINNTISICYAIMKMGGKGRIVDNGANGALWVGIQKDGTLNNWGTDFKCNFADEHNGVSLHGKKVPNFDNVVELAFAAHKRIPMCGMVAWDIALDSVDEPLLIEANLWWPGTSYGEICCGPAFGDRTDEVIEYVKSRELPILGLRHKI